MQANKWDSVKGNGSVTSSSQQVKHVRHCEFLDTDVQSDQA